jgi:perosamine synthetase
LVSDIQAAIGLAQLENVGWHLAQRRRIAKTYHEHLNDINGITLQPELPGYINSYWMTSLLVEQKLAERDWVIVQLADQGIETRPFFYPMHVLPMYKDLCNGQDFPTADDVSSQGINLPSSASLTDDDIHYVCDHLLNILNIQH